MKEFILELNVSGPGLGTQVTPNSIFLHGNSLRKFLQKQNKEIKVLFYTFVEILIRWLQHSRETPWCILRCCLVTFLPSGWWK